MRAPLCRTSRSVRPRSRRSTRATKWSLECLLRAAKTARGMLSTSAGRWPPRDRAAVAWSTRSVLARTWPPRRAQRAQRAQRQESQHALSRPFALALTRPFACPYPRLPSPARSRLPFPARSLALTRACPYPPFRACPHPRLPSHASRRQLRVHHRRGHGQGRLLSPVRVPQHGPHAGRGRPGKRPAPTQCAT